MFFASFVFFVVPKVFESQLMNYLRLTEAPGLRVLWGWVDLSSRVIH